MKRGWDAVHAKGGDIAALPTGEAVSAIGRMLVMNVGGAYGPLYETSFSRQARLWNGAAVT